MKDEGMKLVVFGDSITNGYDSQTQTISPILHTQLEQAALAAGLNLEIILQGMNGATTREGLQRVKQVKHLQASKTLLFFGANDAALHHQMTPQTFLTNLSKMIEQLGGQRVIVLTPPWHDDRFDQKRRSNQRLRVFRRQSLQAAQRFDCPVIDVFNAMQFDEPVKWLQADGLHFSNLGYQKLSQIIIKKLTEIE